MAGESCTHFSVAAGGKQVLVSLVGKFGAITMQAILHLSRVSCMPALGKQVCA